MPATAPSTGALSLPDAIESHSHARAVLLPALPPAGHPSHAYLFHGPAGTGKRAIARAFAAALLADGAPDPRAVAERVERGAHPDLTWVIPSGAAEMLVSDIEEPVVAAATRTPFESERRVFVIESVDRMNDQAANRLLKTLEEPPAFVHLVLLSERPHDVLPTIASRCQHVRFDPLPARLVAERLAEVEGEEAQACARLSGGDALTARWLAGEEGKALRRAAEEYVRSALVGRTPGRPWLALLQAAKDAAARVGVQAQERLAAELELLPSKERKRHEREALEARRRGERRARARALDLALMLGEAWLRDLLCIRQGASELIHARDRATLLEQDAQASTPQTLERGLELVGAARLSLALNVSEELALEALAYRLQALPAAA